MTAIFMVVAAALITAAGRIISDSAKQSKQQEVTLAEAENVARAGLVDAINWFRRTKNVQAGVPINLALYSYNDDAFAPTLNATVRDTLDPSIGIVNQYAVDDFRKLYARYEVRKQKPSPPPVDPLAVHDVTGERMMDNLHQDGHGLIWHLESLGYIFKQMDPTLAYNQYPNKVLATCRMSTEVRKMAIILPCNAAAMAVTMSSINAKKYGKINGNGNFCVGAVTGSAPTTSGSPAGQFVGPVNGTSIGAVTITEEYVFGLKNPQDIKNLADYTGTQANPVTFQGSWKLAYYEGSVTYDPTNANPALRSLNSQGVLYVNGNLTLMDGCNSLYDGLIYVNGAVTIGISNHILGCVIAKNGVVVGTSGGAGDNADINFDQTRINNAINLVAGYREDRAAVKNVQVLPGM
jgi:hypothetical protein